jgi:hypothetical protein
MDRTATGEAFFTRSGSSPPADPAHVTRSSETAPSEGQPLPPQLIEELAALVANALVADIRQFPNLAEIQANHDPTVESPRGHNRRQTTPAPAGGARRPRKAHK